MDESNKTFRYRYTDLVMKSNGSKDAQAHSNTKELPEKNNDLLELLLTSRMI